jgi:FlaA1/EpsC-like NDP-sugar epimerase
LAQKAFSSSMKSRFNWRAALAFAHDVCAAALAWMSIFWLRFNLDLRDPFVGEAWFTLLWILPLQASIFLAFGLYRGLWRFASLADLQRIVLSAGLGAILIPLVLVMTQLQTVVPRSVVVMYPIVLIFLMAGSRFAYRIWKEHRLYSPFAALGEPVLVGRRRRSGARGSPRKWRTAGSGASSACSMTIQQSSTGRFATSGVLGPIADLAVWTRRYGVRKVIIALPSTNHVVRRRVAEQCAAAGVEALTVAVLRRPHLGTAFAHDAAQRRGRRPLSRDPVVLDNAGLAEWLGNRVILLTGAGGSIGAELARQIARFRPARLVLFDVSEAAVYDIQMALGDAFPAAADRSVVGDVKHMALVEAVFAREKPDVVFHAAAYKHVPLMERPTRGRRC